MLKKSGKAKSKKSGIKPKLLRYNTGYNAGLTAAEFRGYNDGCAWQRHFGLTEEPELNDAWSVEYQKGFRDGWNDYLETMRIK